MQQTDETDTWFWLQTPDWKSVLSGAVMGWGVRSGRLCFRGSPFHLSTTHLCLLLLFSRHSVFLSLSATNHSFAPPYAVSYPPFFTSPQPPSHLCLPFAACLSACLCSGCVGAILPEPAACPLAHVLAPANVSARICVMWKEACAVKGCILCNSLLFNSE